MEQNELLLRTAFACMACDGDIAKEEVELIKKMAIERHLFGNIDIDKELNLLVKEINQRGKGFLRQYLLELSDQKLSKEDELKIADVAIQTIHSDNKVEYSEIKFFKVIRSSLNVVTDEDLLENIEGIDDNYLAQDIREDGFQIYNDYFNMIELPQFDLDNQIKS